MTVNHTTFEFYNCHLRGELFIYYREYESIVAYLNKYYGVTHILFAIKNPRTVDSYQGTF